MQITTRNHGSSSFIPVRKVVFGMYQKDYFSVVFGSYLWFSVVFGIYHRRMQSAAAR